MGGGTPHFISYLPHYSTVFRQQPKYLENRHALWWWNNSKKALCTNTLPLVRASATLLVHKSTRDLLECNDRNPICVLICFSFKCCFIYNTAGKKLSLGNTLLPFRDSDSPFQLLSNLSGSQDGTQQGPISQDRKEGRGISTTRVCNIPILWAPYPS